jgi:hypothetical protein
MELKTSADELTFAVNRSPKPVHDIPGNCPRMRQHVSGADEPVRRWRSRRQ